MHRSSLYSRDARVRARLKTLRPTRAVVDLDALAANFGYLRERAAGADVLCVVKADGYGHGAVPVARRLEAEGARWFGVAILEEGLELRAAGIGGRILVLGGLDRDQLALGLAEDLTPAVISDASFEDLVDASEHAERALSCHLKVDTGMTRLGIPWWEFGGFASRLATEAAWRMPDGTPRVAIEGFFTHLACSDDPAVPFTGVQLERFRNALAALLATGMPHPLVHVASSAGLLTRADAQVSLVRPGVALYGLNPFGNEEAPELTGALTLLSRIVRLVEAPAGTPVGYGSTFHAIRTSRLATIPIGYDDGLVRGLSDHWEVAVRGQLVPLVGRISMDLVVADVTGVPGATVGDDVVLAGGGLVAHRVEEMARRLRTIPYEITCGISSRVPRVFMDQGEVVGIDSRFESLPALQAEVPPMLAPRKDSTDVAEPPAAVSSQGPVTAKAAASADDAGSAQAAPAGEAAAS